MEDENGKYEVTGLAFAQLDAGQKELLVLTFRPDTEPAPSCELVAATNTIKRGGFVGFTAAAFGGAPGSFAVNRGSVFLGDPGKGEMTVISLPVTTTTFALRAYGGDSFSGEVTSTGAAPKLAGTVSGRICPNAATPSVVPMAAPVDDSTPGPDKTDKTDKAEKPPPVVAKVDTDGIAGITIGLSVKKLPKGATKKAPLAGQSKDVTTYNAKGVLYMGEPIVEATIAVVGGVVAQMTASIDHCDKVLDKLKTRYGESGKAALDGSVWRGMKTELTFVPFQGGSCLVTYAKIAPK